jgi:hypothetical protein
MVPIRCSISIGVEEETTLVEPLLLVRDMELMFMEKESIQSAGESPMLTWTAVFAAGVGFDPVLLAVDPPLQPLSATARMAVTQMTVCWLLYGTNSIEFFECPWSLPREAREAWT